MFKGLGGLGDMGKMMKAAQEMQGKMSQMQEEMVNIMVEGQAGAGMVKATCSAKGDLKALNIDPTIFVCNTDQPQRLQMNTGSPTCRTNRLQAISDHSIHFI